MNNNEEKYHLNDRQLRLYNYLLQNNEYWLQREKILSDLAEFYGYKGEDNLYKCSAATRLTEDIRYLNDNAYIRKIIISNTQKGVKIANREEAIEYLDKSFQCALKRIKKHSTLQNKMLLDGQVSYVNDGFKVLDTFVKER